MIRIALIGFFAWIIYKLYKMMLRKAAGQKNKQQVWQVRRTRSNSAKTLEPGEMVSCAKCKTFVLKKEAVEKNGQYFCSKSCV